MVDFENKFSEINSILIKEKKSQIVVVSANVIWQSASFYSLNGKSSGRDKTRKRKPPWGDFLRSVPCVTVWHQKIKFYTVSAGEKSLKTYLVYVPMITKNCRGHLPDRSYLDTRIVHVTQWRFWENISKKHFLDKKNSHINIQNAF